MNYKILFKRGKGVYDFIKGKEKDGLISFQKKTWFVKNSKPKFIRAPKIDYEWMPLLVMFFMYMVIISSFYGIIFMIMMAMFSVLFSAIIPTMKGTKPFFILSLDSSTPLEDSIEKEMEKESKEKIRKLIKNVVKRFHKNLDDAELNETINMTEQEFTTLADPTGLFALLNRETMRESVRKPKMKFDMIFYMLIGAALGGMGAFIIVTQQMV